MLTEVLWVVKTIGSRCRQVKSVGNLASSGIVVLTPNSARKQGKRVSPKEIGTQAQDCRLTLGVSRHGPLALRDHVLDSLGDLRASLGDVVELSRGRQSSAENAECLRKRATDGELVEGAGVLNVLEGRVEVAELRLDLGGSLLGRRNLWNRTLCVNTVCEALFSLQKARVEGPSSRSRTSRGATRRWRATHGLGLEGSDGLELSLDVVVDSLEALEELLALGDNVLVLEDLAVVLEVDGRLLLLDGGVGSPGSGSALTESAELTERLCSIAYAVPRVEVEAVRNRGAGGEGERTGTSV